MKDALIQIQNDNKFNLKKMKKIRIKYYYLM